MPDGSVAEGGRKNVEILMTNHTTGAFVSVRGLSGWPETLSVPFSAIRIEGGTTSVEDFITWKTTNTANFSGAGIALPSDLTLNYYYATVYTLTQQTLTITTQSTYQPLNVTTIEATRKLGMEKSLTRPFAIRNISFEARLFEVSADIDVSGASGNEYRIALAVNDVVLPETAQSSRNGTHKTIFTKWLVALRPGDEVGVHVANFTNTSNIVVDRGRLIAYAIAPVVNAHYSNAHYSPSHYSTLLP